MSTCHPDYATLRARTPFTWYIGSNFNALLGLVPDVTLYEVNTDPKAMIELVRRGLPLFDDLFDRRVRRPALTTPPVSYSHVNGLGVDLVFPEEGEVNYKRQDRSLEEWIDVFQRPVDWATAGMMPFFLDYREQLRKAFPGKEVNIALGYEGPITTAYELRDMRIFTDVYDAPEMLRKFLELETQSIIDFAHFRWALDGKPAVDTEGRGLVDDISSMIAPSMWPELVVPNHNAYFNGLTTGKRSAHIEDLRPDHLQYLEQIELFKFDPSISPKLSPPDLRDRCRVPFDWRLGSFHYATMTETDVRDWVFQAVADGASCVFTHVAEGMTRDSTVKKVHAFIRAAADVEKALEAGATRADLATEVSEAGRRRFWGTWPD